MDFAFYWEFRNPDLKIQIQISQSKAPCVSGNSNSIAIIPNITLGACRPFPTMVELPKAPGENLFPTSHVILHRCVGNCMQDAHNCTVTRQEEIKYSVWEVATRRPKTITVYNHTKCACNCKTRESDCKLTVQNFDVDSCSCKCILNGSHCSANHVWSERSCQCQCNNFCSYPHFLNTTTCQCQCINPPSCDTTVNQFLNDQTCECDCPQNVKKRCARKGKVLNKQRCECECPTPRPTCGPGTSFLRYNCTCV